MSLSSTGLLCICHFNEVTATRHSVIQSSKSLTACCNNLSSAILFLDLISFLIFCFISLVMVSTLGISAVSLHSSFPIELHVLVYHQYPLTAARFVPAVLWSSPWHIVANWYFTVHCLFIFPLYHRTCIPCCCRRSYHVLLFVLFPYMLQSVKRSQQICQWKLFSGQRFFFCYRTFFLWTRKIH